MTEEEVIDTLMLAILRPSVGAADSLGFKITSGGLKEVYNRIIDFYEMNKVKESSGTGEAMEAIIIVGGHKLEEGETIAGVLESR